MSFFDLNSLIMSFKQRVPFQPFACNRTMTKPSRITQFCWIWCGAGRVLSKFHFWRAIKGLLFIYKAKLMTQTKKSWKMYILPIRFHQETNTIIIFYWEMTWYFRVPWAKSETSTLWKNPQNLEISKNYLTRVHL